MNCRNIWSSQKRLCCTSLFFKHTPYDKTQRVGAKSPLKSTSLFFRPDGESAFFFFQENRKRRMRKQMKLIILIKDLTFRLLPSLPLSHPEGPLSLSSVLSAPLDEEEQRLYSEFLRVYPGFVLSVMTQSSLPQVGVGT